MCKFLCQHKPHFLNASAHSWRHREECAEHDRNLHCGRQTSVKTRRSESTARLISKRCKKQSLALARIVSRSATDVRIQRSITRVIPSRLSWSANPAPSFTISRQMLTLLEIKTGVAQASASATAIPKFS